MRSQCERLLSRLESGPVEPLTALSELGIYRLAARITICAMPATRSPASLSTSAIGSAKRAGSLRIGWKSNAQRLRYTGKKTPAGSGPARPSGFVYSMEKIVMARARNIKPGFFKNEFLAEMPCEARLLFIGLWTLADREGRLEDRPKRIKAELFAFDCFDVDSMLNLLQRDMFVLRYEVNGVRFIQIENFVKHQDPHYKEKASDIPAPEGRDNLIIASGVTRTQRARIYERDLYTCQYCGSKEHLCIDHVLPVSRGGDSSDENLQTLCMSCNTTKGNKLDGEEKNSRQRRINIDSNLNQKNCASPSDSLIPDSGFLIPDSLQEQSAPDQPEKKKPTATATRLPADWVPSDDDIEFCKTERTDLIYSVVADRFRDYWIAQPGAKGRKLDWSATWRNWVRNEKLINQPAKTQYQINQEATARALFGHRVASNEPKVITGEVVA